MHHCSVCNSQRQGEVCWKCGSKTQVPPLDWTYPRTPDIEKIRVLVRDVGYALGEHGSKERDLDLMAMPWTKDAIGAHTLIDYLATALKARIVSIERKPLGRIAATLQIDGYYKPIDLSIAPLISSD